MCNNIYPYYMIISPKRRNGMAISKCISLLSGNESESVDPLFRINETGCHGTADFPAAVYLDDVTDSHVSWHRHEEFEFGFVTEGSVAVWCGGRKYSLERGDIFFVNSNVLHSMHNNKTDMRAVFKSIVFGGSIVGGSINSVFYTKYLIPVLNSSTLRDHVITSDSTVHHETLSLLSDIWDAIYFEPSDHEITVRNALSRLFCILLRLHESEPDSAGRNPQDLMRENRVRVLLDYIHAHYSEKTTLDDLAKAAFVSKTEVLRCFKYIIGQSPINYLKEYRLQRAAYIIANTDKNIGRIGEECGFEDNSYFTKAFKEMYRCTPHAYREKSSGNNNISR